MLHVVYWRVWGFEINTYRLTSHRARSKYSIKEFSSTQEHVLAAVISVWQIKCILSTDFEAHKHQFNVKSHVSQRSVDSSCTGWFPAGDAESESAAQKRASISWARRDSLCSHCTFCYSRIALELVIPLSACRQAAVMSPSQRPRWEQGHPCCQHKALCHRGVTAGRASLLPHCARLCVCVCMHWKHYPYCLLMSFFLPPLDTIPNNAERSKGYYHSSIVFMASVQLLYQRFWCKLFFFALQLAIWSSFTFSSWCLSGLTGRRLGPDQLALPKQ